MISPIFIFKTEAGEIGFKWDDGTHSLFNLRELRIFCPCALCVDEHTGERILDPKTIPDPISILKIQSIGRYAVGISWSDGHQSGIYSYKFLKQLTK